MHTQIANTTPIAVRGSAEQNASMVRFAPGIEMPALMMKYSRNEEIFGEDEPADFVYKVVSGTVRTVQILADGRRQIGEFYVAGDVFGFETGPEHHIAAEAVVDCRIALLRRSAVERSAARDAALAGRLWALALSDLRRAQEHQLLLGRKSALERVVHFLRVMAARQQDGGPVALPMSRADIADYLGLTIETVSRMMTQLERRQVISLPTSRTTIFCDTRALARLDA